MGMTQIEHDVARTTLRMNKAVADHFENIDWEQRRYEIAKVMFPSCATAVNQDPPDWAQGMSYPQAGARLAIKYADALIEELKKL